MISKQRQNQIPGMNYKTKYEMWCREAKRKYEEWIREYRKK